MDVTAIPHGVVLMLGLRRPYVDIIYSQELRDRLRDAPEPLVGVNVHADEPSSVVVLPFSQAARRHVLRYADEAGMRRRRFLIPAARWKNYTSRFASTLGRTALFVLRYAAVAPTRAVLMGRSRR